MRKPPVTRALHLSSVMLVFVGIALALPPAAASQSALGPGPMCMSVTGGKIPVTRLEIYGLLMGGSPLQQFLLSAESFAMMRARPSAQTLRSPVPR